MNESCFLVAKLGCLQCVIDLCNEIYDKLQQPPLKFHKILITLSSNISKMTLSPLSFINAIDKYIPSHIKTPIFLNIPLGN